MAAITEPAPDTVDEPSSTVPRVGPPRWVAIAIVALLVASAAVWWAKREPDPRRLGDRGQVTAEIDDLCNDLGIHVDGLDLRHQFSPPDGGDPMPAQWQNGDRIEGRLRITGTTSTYGVRGTFTADDGTTVPVRGGISGKVFFTLGCAIGP